MNNIQRSAPTSTPQKPAAKPVYQPPRVTDLGAWQAVTLINSVPFNGTGAGGIFGSDKL